MNLGKYLKETQFAAIRGSQVEGQIALSDHLINQLIQVSLSKGESPLTSNPSPASHKKESPSAPPIAFKHLKHRTETGRTIVEIKLITR